MKLNLGATHEGVHLFADGVHIVLSPTLAREIAPALQRFAAWADALQVSAAAEAIAELEREGFVWRADGKEGDYLYDPERGYWCAVSEDGDEEKITPLARKNESALEIWSALRDDSMSQPERPEFIN